MITYNNDLETAEIICDGMGCDNSAYFDDVSFQEAVDLVKKRGWKLKQIASMWEHYCPACVKEGMHE